MTRPAAYLLALSLAGAAAVAVIASAAPTPRRGEATVGELALTSDARTGHSGVISCGRLAAPRPARQVACLSTRVLERIGRQVAVHGGVRSSAYGDATPWLKAISRELVARAFPPWARRWAACIVGREAGWNTGAISPADDYSLGQLHAGLWPVDYQRQLRDPGYAARAFALVSLHGRRTWPWNGGRYAC